MGEHLHPKLTTLGNVVHMLAGAIRSAAPIANIDWCESIGLSAHFLDGEVHHPFQVVNLPKKPTVPGELVRVYWDWPNGEAAQLMFSAALIDELEPFIMGVGKIRVFCAPNGIIVVRKDDWEREFMTAGHLVSYSNRSPSPDDLDFSQ